MDARNVRVIRCCNEDEKNDNFVYIDESARFYLGMLEWGDEVKVIGRRESSAIIHPLPQCDFDGQLVRMSNALRGKLMIEWGEEVLLDHM